MAATAVKTRDSFLGFWLEGLISNINAEIGYLPAYFQIKEAENNLKLVNKEQKVETVTGEVVDDPIGTDISDLIWNDHKMRFTRSEAEDEYDFSDPISGAVPYHGNAMGLNFELSDDQLDNFIDDALNDLKPKDNDEAKLFRYIMLTVLASTNKISAKQCTDRCNSKEENLILCNSIFRYFNNFPWFSMSVVDINEYATKEQLLRVMVYLNGKSMFDVDYAFAGMLRKVQDDYAKEERRRISNNGEKEVSDDDIITPIVFNNAFLNSVDLMSGNVPAPMVSPGIVKVIRNKVAKLLGIDLNDKKQETAVTVEGRIDPDNPTSCSDIGQALVSVKNKHTGFISKQIIVDLDNITATGLNIMAKAIDPNGQLVMVFVNLDKDEDIARKILINQGEYIINAMTEEGKKEFDKVNAKLLPDPRVYAYYDFSNMHKNLESLTNKQAKRFANRLMEIAGLPWFNLGMQSIGAPFRFRFRDFKSYNDFVLISDKDVRVQDRTWMAKPINNPYGKLYMHKAGVQTEDKLIVSVKGNNFTVTLNGQDVDWQQPQQ